MTDVFFETRLQRGRICRHGAMIYFPHDFYIGSALELYGEYAELEAQFLCKMLGPGDIAIDAGANIGCLTLPMARKVGIEGRVFAFEPQRILFNILCANLALNQLWNVIAKQEALASEVSRLGVPMLDYTAPGNFGGLALQAGELPEMVEAVPIDDLGLPRCRLIKADVQGMEMALLQGARDTIARCAPFLYVENDTDTSALPALMRELGYDVYEHKTPLFNPHNFRQYHENKYPNVVSYNLLGVPEVLREAVNVQLRPWDFIKH